MRENEGTAAPRTLSMSEAVTRDLRQEILGGALRPGQEFMLRETARRYGVSTAPVRDAIRILQSEGLINVQRARSAVVAPMDAKDLASIFDLRLRIEPDLAARAGPVLSDERLVQLEADVQRFDRPGDPEAWEHHMAFHAALLGPVASRWENRVLELLCHAAERYSRIALSRRPAGELASGPLSHAWLVTEFRSHDANRIREAMRAHLEESRDFAATALS